MLCRLQRPCLALVAFAAALLLLSAGRAEAATFSVNTTSDTPLSGAMCTGAEPCSLRAAVQAADAAGGSNTITLPAGTYVLAVPSTGADNPANGDLDIDSNTSVTIQGAGSGTTVIDAAGIDRAFAVQAGSGLALSAMTIEGGVAAAASSGERHGGAIYSDGELSAGPDLVLTDNEAVSGGAVYVGTNAPEASFTKVTIKGNRAAGGEGGGIAAVTNGTVSVESSSLTENDTATSDGGNLYVGSAAAFSSVDTDYTLGTSNYGGGAYIAYAATPLAEFTGGSFSENQVQGRGGGLYTESPADVTGVSFTDNSAQERGGAFGTGTPVLLRIVGSTFLDNSSESSGALDISSYASETVIVNSTFSRNAASNAGSAIGGYYFLNKFDLINSTVVGNLGPAPAIGSMGILEPYEVGVVNSIVVQNAGADCETRLSTDDGGHNILGSTCEAEPADPTDLIEVDPLLDPPGDNGGGVETMALQVGSPAIDAGDAAACPATDARGVSRSGGCDIGAFEYATPAPEPPAPGPGPTPTPTPDPGTPSQGTGGPTSNSGVAAASAGATAPAKYKFGIKKILHVQKGGTAKLRIRYNGPGLIELSGKRVETVSRRTQAGVAYLPIVPNEALTTMLSERGRVHVTVMVQFTPDAGVGRIKEKKVGVWLYG